MSAAKQIHITQGTPEWHAWRRPLIGASDVAALFGESPYKTKRDLWFEKAGLGEPDDEDRSYIYRRGHEVEAEIRLLFIKETGIEVSPTCFEKDGLYGVSLDGYKRMIAILEAKFVGAEVFKQASLTREIPRHHWIQIQSQLHGSDSDKAWWGAKTPKSKDTIAIDFGRDEKFIGLIRDESERFRESLDKNQPPPLSAEDTLFITSPDQIRLFDQLQSLKEEKIRLDTQYAELETQIKDLATHNRVKCGGVSITEVVRAGSIDYGKIPEIKAMKKEYLEQFRKRESIFKTIRFGKVSGDGA